MTRGKTSPISFSNKRIFRLSCVLVLFLVLGMFLGIHMFKQKRFDLGSIVWEYLGENRSLVTVKKNSMKIGPGNIHLWKKDPYVFGICEGNPIMANRPFFLLDLDNLELMTFSEADDRFFHELRLRKLDIRHIVGIGALLFSPEKEQIRQQLSLGVVPVQENAGIK